MAKFKYSLFFPATLEQRREIREILKGFGYFLKDFESQHEKAHTSFCTNYSDVNGKMGSTSTPLYQQDSVASYDKPLIVALAAMREDGPGEVGEIWQFVDGYEDAFYRIVEKESNELYCIQGISSEGYKTQKYGYSIPDDKNRWRRATKEQILKLNSQGKLSALLVEENEEDDEDWSILDESEDFSCLNDL